jgi:putative holliday junction resolvase
MNNSIKDKIYGKRVGGIDYGRKRLGIAVCDELHISITPLKVLNPGTGNFWDEFIAIIKKENISYLVVGVPYRLDNKKTEVISQIEIFIDELIKRTGIEVFKFDESYSTIRATETLIDIGRKKKKRRQKESKDLVAAAIILRDFLKENE